MECRYCGKEVPLRMRLTGEEYFCSPAHKRMYQEEHSRIGLARLMEEVSQDQEESPREPAGATPVELAEPAEEEAATPPEPPLSEPELVASGGGLKLWLHPRVEYEPEPMYDTLLQLDLVPSGYVPPPKLEILEESEQEALVEVAASVEEAPVIGSGDDITAGDTPSAQPSEIPPSAREPRQAPNPALHGEHPADAVESAELAGRKAADSKHSLAPAALAAEKPPREQEEAPVVSKKTSQAPETSRVAAFQFASYAEPKKPASSSSRGLGLAAGALLAVLLGAGGYLGLSYLTENSSMEPAAVESATSIEQWIPKWSDGDQGEEIALFGPSQEWSDYRVEWETGSKNGIAWVFRAKDQGNYYALRLHQQEPGSLSLVRYAVIGGRKLGLSESVIEVPRSAYDGIGLELEVRGARFTLLMDGQNVADWSDDRLERGGFGIIRPEMGLAGMNNVKVVQLERKSVSRSEGFWTGELPYELPQVTLIGNRTADNSAIEGLKSEESSL